MHWFITSILNWLSRQLPSKVHDDPAYQKAHEFKNIFSPTEGVNYDWIEDYARLIYDRFDQADQTLDAKAESIIKVLGGGTGLLTLGAIINLPKLGLPVAIALAFSVLLALVAICTMNSVPKEQSCGGASMSPDSQHNTPPAPDPAGSQQTPNPATSAEPQSIDRDATSAQPGPAEQAEPQSIQASPATGK
ncbi:MAG: hypothetical protein ABIP48_11920 [Planctomycetota bacterium]